MSENVIQLMEKLVKIPSVFPNEQKVTNFLETYLRELGFSIQRVPAEPGRDNLVATFGESEKFVCFYGHMDTVPAHLEWQQDPFAVTVDGDTAHGLGVTDMKGGIAAILVAARFAVEHHLPIKIALGVDEENISLGSYTLVQTDFFKDVVLLISAESGQIFNENQDFSVNYGRKGRVAIEAQVEGKTAHAARSDLAVNAILEAARFVDGLKELDFPAHKNLGRTEVIPFFIESATDSFSIPEKAVVKLNVLTVPGVFSTLVLKKLNTLAKQLKIRATFQLIPRPTPYMEAYEVDLQNSYIQDLEKKIFAKYAVTPGYAISVADENRFADALGIPVISLGPIGGDDHTAKEWVSVRSLEKTAQVYQEILQLFHSTQ